MQLKNNHPRTTIIEADDGKQRVGFLVFEGFKLLDISGPAEAFDEANRFGANYEVEFVSPTGLDAVSSLGLSVSVTCSARDAAAFDTVLVSGGDLLPRTIIGQDIIDAAKHLTGRTRRIASVCTGAFILAATGLLDGRRATTHWQHAAQLGALHRNVHVEPDSIFVKDEYVYTSAGMTAGIDLALALIEEDHGAEIARNVAKSLVMYMQRSGGQSQFSIPLQGLSPVSSPLQNVVKIIQRDPAATYSVQDLAQQVHLSARHLSRLFREEMETTPGKFIDLVRFETARTLLDAGLSISAVAQRSGFGNPESLRRSFISHIGIPPSKYQQHFLTTKSHYHPETSVSESEG